MVATGEPPAPIVADAGPGQVTDDRGDRRRRSMRSSRPTPTRSPSTARGKDKLFGFFVGQVMKATQGKANPQKVNEILRSRLQT